jgi:hypothetical protein
MTVQNATPQTSSNLGPRGPLTLKILGGMRDGQLVRLNSPKCTVGSDRRCTFRLRGERILPLHCLIIRGRQATVIRRWSSDTTVNGHSFLDAPLSVGDRLSIGPVQLEIVSDEGPIEARTEDAVDPRNAEVRRQGRRRA